MLVLWRPHKIAGSLLAHLGVKAAPRGRAIHLAQAWDVVVIELLVSDTC